MFSIENKVAIVTGGANGIGASIIWEFLKENIKHVAIIDVDVDSGMKLQEEINLRYGKVKATFFKCDVTKEDQLQDAFSKVIKENGRIDLVVNNAGVADDSPEKYKQTININFTALVTSSLKALDHMRVDKGGKGGTILNVSSASALDPSFLPLHIYASTKAAVVQFSTRLGMDLLYSRTKVRVMCVCFGGTDTKIMGKCRGLDYVTDENMKMLVDSFKAQNIIQSATVAARCLVHVLQKGDSASVWLVNNKEVIDITNTLKEANANIREIVGGKNK